MPIVSHSGRKLHRQAVEWFEKFGTSVWEAFVDEVRMGRCVCVRCQVSVGVR